MAQQVKDPSQLWLTFDLWPRNLYMPWVLAGKRGGGGGGRKERKQEERKREGREREKEGKDKNHFKALHFRFPQV